MKLCNIYTFLIGFIDESAVQQLLSECAKMEKFDNLHVMSLKGVCLDGGPVPYIVLPYMANGSLASYLKKERKNLIVMRDNIENDETQTQVSWYTITVIHRYTYNDSLRVSSGPDRAFSIPFAELHKQINNS